MFKQVSPAIRCGISQCYLLLPLTGELAPP